MRESPRAALYGFPIGILGGLIGLGGAEFRLPVLKAVFRHPIHRAVALNLAVSLITLVASLGVRLLVAAPSTAGAWLPVLAGLIAGSMLGAYLGAAYAGRLSVQRLERSVLVLLTGIGLLLVIEGFFPLRSLALVESVAVRLPVAAILGIGIGLVSSLLGVAGGEIIIPTLVLVFGADIKTAGTLSVIISLPTVVVGLWRHARREPLRRVDLRELVLPMGLSSIVGAVVGGYLVPYAPGEALKIALGVILVVSAIRIFRHRAAASTVEAGPAAEARSKPTPE